MTAIAVCSIPLVPSEVDLRDFQFMPLDCVRFRDSGLVADADPAAAFFAVVLWAAAWHQVPAATLPATDTGLAKLAGFGRDLAGWNAVKADALRGFVRCDDGRLHHPVIAEKALEAWRAKLAARLKGGVGNARRWGYAFDPAALQAQIARADRALKAVRDRLGGNADTGPHAAHDAAGALGDLFEGAPAPAETESEQGNIPERSPGDRSRIAIESEGTVNQERGERRASPRPTPPTPAKALAVAVHSATESEAHAMTLASEHPAPSPDIDPLAWGGFLAQLEFDGKLSGPRLMAARGQVRAHKAAGRDVNAILSSAVSRGFRDLSDARLIPQGSPGAAESKTKQAIKRATTRREDRK
jgi:hypothetical protein